MVTPRTSLHHHLLVELRSHTDPKGQFLCDGCKMHGTGERFQCEMCNFNLHVHCATCPASLSSFLHEGPGHKLILVQGQWQDRVDRSCNVCNGGIEGPLFYRCDCVLCEFYVHPGCTRLPREVKHARDEHPLTFQLMSSGQCLVCHRTCSGWRYRCSLCEIDIHFPCLLDWCPIPMRSSSRSTPYHPPAYHSPMTSSPYPHYPTFYPWPAPSPYPPTSSHFSSAHADGANITGMPSTVVYAVIGSIVQAAASVIFGGIFG
ncbi:hypothetical protein SAY86_028843 [Trapa natans]|uniref:DC1 domain-containing protein n=1 Tax=Trapa natans TaxID=22666 RepID=A0AAN7RB52_TRANT|nr:hypothetical protein SAY86_028843 [Trapa natans]